MRRLYKTAYGVEHVREPEGWTAPIRKTWKELKSLAVVKVAVIRKKIHRVSVLRDHNSKVRSPKHITKGRKCSEKLGRNNHERMIINRRLR